MSHSMAANMHRLQMVQSAAAKKSDVKFDHIQDRTTRYTLHWIPTEARIKIMSEIMKNWTVSKKPHY